MYTFTKCTLFLTVLTLCFSLISMESDTAQEVAFYKALVERRKSDALQILTDNPSIDINKSMIKILQAIKQSMDIDNLEMKETFQADMLECLVRRGLKIDPAKGIEILFSKALNQKNLPLIKFCFKYHMFEPKALGQNLLLLPMMLYVKLTPDSSLLGVPHPSELRSLIETYTKEIVTIIASQDVLSEQKLWESLLDSFLIFPLHSLMLFTLEHKRIPPLYEFIAQSIEACIGALNALPKSAFTIVPEVKQCLTKKLAFVGSTSLTKLLLIKGILTHEDISTMSKEAKNPSLLGTQCTFCKDLCIRESVCLELLRTQEFLTQAKAYLQERNKQFLAYLEQYSTVKQLLTDKQNNQSVLPLDLACEIALYSLYQSTAPELLPILAKKEDTQEQCHQM